MEALLMIIFEPFHIRNVAVLNGDANAIKLVSAPKGPLGVNTYQSQYVIGIPNASADTENEDVR